MARQAAAFCSTGPSSLSSAVLFSHMYMYISIDTQQTLRPNGLHVHVHVHTYIRTCTYMYFTHANYIYMYLIDEVVTAGIPKIHKGTRRSINCWAQVIMCSRSPVVYYRYPCRKNIGGWEDSECHDMQTEV